MRIGDPKLAVRATMDRTSSGRPATHLYPLAFLLTVVSACVSGQSTADAGLSGRVRSITTFETAFAERFGEHVESPREMASRKRYDRAGNLLESTNLFDDGGQTWVYEREGDGQVTMLLFEDGVHLMTIQRRHDGELLLEEETLREGVLDSEREYRYTRDTAGRVTRRDELIDAEFASRIDYRYEDGTLVEQVSYNQRGATTALMRYTYDEAGRLSREHRFRDTGEQAAEVSYLYDDLGDLVEIRERSQVTRLEYSYDKLGRLIARREGSRRYAYEYDVDGRVAVETIDNTEYEHRYDDAGRLIEKLGSERWTYAYRVDGTLAVTREYRGNTLIEVEYDEHGSPVREQTFVLPEDYRIIERYAYDDEGRQVDYRQLDALERLVEGHQTQYESGRVVQVRYYTTNPSSHHKIDQYYHDHDSCHPRQGNRPVIHSICYEYFDTGAVAREREFRGNESRPLFERHYDDAGRTTLDMWNERNMTFEVHTEYGDHGLPLRRTDRTTRRGDVTPHASESTTVYEYELDGRGNWTKRTAYEPATRFGQEELIPLRATYREIAYW